MDRRHLYRVIAIAFAILSLGVGANAASIYWVDSLADKIFTADLDGSNSRVLLEADAPVAIAVSRAEAKIYFAEAIGPDWRISRANYDGSGVEDVADVELGIGLAVDDVGKKLYWTDAHGDRVRRANLDGSDAEDLVAAMSPTRIAIDSTLGKMFWNEERINGGIYQANLDGSNVEKLIDAISIGIAVDRHAEKLYFMAGGTIQRANLDGSDIEEIAPGPHTSAVALDGMGRLYWADFVDGVFRANLDGSNVETIAVGHSPFDLTINPEPTTGLLLALGLLGLGASRPRARTPSHR